jgi:MYXO-CTERM domain-containing protein
MRSPLKNQYFLAAFVLALPLVGFGGDISINGTCVQGTCPPPSGTTDAIQFGTSIGPTPGSTTMTVNGDPYSISWITQASYGSGGVAILDTPTVTYTGLTPTTSTDAIVINFYQSIYDARCCNWDGNYTETVPLTLTANAGAGSSVEGQLIIDGATDLPLVGPIGPGSSTVGQHTEDLVGFPGDTNDNVVYQYQFTFDFDPGTTDGATGTAATPEPSQALPVGLALAGAALFGFIRRR